MGPLTASFIHRPESITLAALKTIRAAPPDGMPIRMILDTLELSDLRGEHLRSPHYA